MKSDTLENALCTELKGLREVDYKPILINYQTGFVFVLKGVKLDRYPVQAGFTCLSTERYCH